MIKTLSQLVECYDCNPGNNVNRGVTNHLTPLNNIITNVRNFFGSTMGVIVEPGEDGVSLKLHSSKFVCPKEVSKVIDQPYLGNTSLHSYICQQGLCNMKLINLGSYYIVYFGPNDIRTAENPDKVAADAKCCKAVACTEMLQYNLNECEMDSLNEAFDDEELEVYKDHLDMAGNFRVRLNENTGAKEIYLNFGKHKGKTIDQVDKTYFQWMVNNSEGFPVDTRYFAKKVLVKLG